MSDRERNLEHLRVLLVEDDPDTRATIRMMLGEMGLSHIYDSSDGREGLEFIEESPDRVDMVLCDWNIPNITGVDLLKRLRTLYPKLPFLMITGRSDIESIKEAKKYGVNAYIRKPFSYKGLKEKIETVLEQRRP
jgi:DNA-binding NtrC family response regulator